MIAGGFCTIPSGAMTTSPTTTASVNAISNNKTVLIALIAL